MVFFQSSSERARHASTELTLTKAKEVLDEPAVLNSLGQHGLFLNSILQHQLYVPNVRHGVISRPRKTPDEQIPIVSMYDGETLTATDPNVHTLTPLQVESLDRYLQSHKNNGDEINLSTSLINLVHKHAHRRPQKYSMTDAEARVQTIDMTIKLDRKKGHALMRRIGSRPVMLIRVGQEFSPLVGSNLAHELTHVKQLTDSVVSHPHPERVFRKNTRMELEAYRYSAEVSEALYTQSTNPHYRKNLECIDVISYYINDARKKVNFDKKDPYALDQNLVDAIEDSFGEYGFTVPRFIYKKN